MNGERDRTPGLAEKAFVVMSLLFFLDAFLPLYQGTAGAGNDAGEGNRLALALSFCIYSVTVALAWRRMKLISSLWKQEYFLAALIGLAIFSAAWSDVPLLTMRRTVSLLGTCLFGSYFATRYTLREQLNLIAATCCIALFSSCLVAVLLPSIGASASGSGLRGIFFTKNVLGRAMAFSVLVLALLEARTTVYRVAKWLLVALSLLLLVLSGSMTALIVCVAVSLLVPLYKSFRCDIDFHIFVICFYIVTGLLSVLWLSVETRTVLDLFHRDLTFTGRIDLWESVLTMTDKRPLLGYGYNAFWLGEKGESAALWRMVGWRTPHAHNGLLDLWLNLGLLGVGIFVAGFLRVVNGAIRFVRTSRGALGLWPLLYLTFFSFANLTESALARHNSIFWVLYVSTVCTCCMRKAVADEPEFETAGGCPKPCA